MAIGKGLGSLMQVEDCSGVQKTFRSHLRILVKIDVLEPLKPGFYLSCQEGEPHWISFKYERLDIYCTTCGRIGHKEQHCYATPAEVTLGKYSISLKVNIFSNLPPHHFGVWGSSEGASYQSPPPSSQKTTLTLGDKHNSQNILTPLSLNPSITCHNNLNFSQSPFLNHYPLQINIPQH